MHFLRTAFFGLLFLQFSQAAFALPSHWEIRSEFDQLASTLRAKDSGKALLHLKQVVSFFAEVPLSEPSPEAEALLAGIEGVFGMNRGGGVVLKFHVKSANENFSQWDVWSVKSKTREWEARAAVRWNKKHTQLDAVQFNEHDYGGHNDWSFSTVEATLKNRNVWTVELVKVAANLLEYPLPQNIQNYVVTTVLLASKKPNEFLGQYNGKAKQRVKAFFSVETPGLNPCLKGLVH